MDRSRFFLKTERWLLAYSADGRIPAKYDLSRLRGCEDPETPEFVRSFAGWDLGANTNSPSIIDLSSN
jgi:hypothetical protein